MSGRNAGPSLPRIPSLDGLRGVAILVVIMMHCIMSTPGSNMRTLDAVFARAFGLFAPASMDLFFVISGFLITAILDRTRDADHPVRTFYLRRALRIVPLYYGFLIVVIVFLQHLPDRLVGRPGSMIWEFLFMTNVPMGLHGTRAVASFYPHFWTLAIEEQFYILWPLLILLVPQRLNIKTCLAVIALSVITRAVLVSSVLPEASMFLTPARLDGLAAGAFVALVHARRPDLLSAWSRKGMWIAAAASVLVQLTLVMMFLAGMKELSIKTWIALMPLLGTAFFAAVVAQLAMKPGGKSPRWLVSPVLTTVARYSYGMYALHVPIINLLFHYELVVQRAPVAGFDLPYRVSFFILVAGLSYGAGLVSWHLYEKQFLKLAPRYGYSRKAQPVVPAFQAGALPVP